MNRGGGSRGGADEYWQHRNTQRTDTIEGVGVPEQYAVDYLQMAKGFVIKLEVKALEEVQYSIAIERQVLETSDTDFFPSS